MSGLDVADGLSTGSEQVMLVCPLLAVISGHSVMSERCPLYSQKRTLIERPDGAAGETALFDHLVGDGEQA